MISLALCPEASAAKCRAQGSSVGSVPFAQNHDVVRLVSIADDPASLGIRRGLAVARAPRSLHRKTMSSGAIVRTKCKPSRGPGSMNSFSRTVFTELFVEDADDSCCRKKCKIRGGRPRRNNPDPVECFVRVARASKTLIVSVGLSATGAASGSQCASRTMLCKPVEFAGPINLTWILSRISAGAS